MKIGIIGAGNVGTGLAKHRVPNGLEVMLSYSRDPAKLQASAKELGAKAGTVSEAVAFGELIVLATPYTATGDALKQVGRLHQSTKPDFSGLLIGTTTSAGEQTAALAPWAKVVKAIPPFAEVMHSESMEIGGVRPGVFICGDDAKSRGVVDHLVKAIGADPVDTGAWCCRATLNPPTCSWSRWPMGTDSGRGLVLP